MPPEASGSGPVVIDRELRQHVLVEPQAPGAGKNYRALFLPSSTAGWESDLGFYARSIQVTNPTNQWLFLPDAWKFVPPLTFGAIFTVPSPSQKAHVLWSAPPGVTQPAAVGGQNALIEFCEADLTPSSGTSTSTSSSPLPITISDPIVKSTNNSTTTPLAAGASFIGAADAILNYQQVNLTLFGNPAGAEGSLYFEFSPDGTHWDISVPIVVRNLNIFIPYPLINVGAFYRVRYLNDGGASAIAALGLSETAGTPTNQTEFRLTSYLLPLATKEIARTLDQQIAGSDPIALVRSVSTGKDTNGIFVNAPGAGVNNANSSSTPLGANATFTGSSFIDLNQYAGYSIGVNSDQNGTLLIDVSEDGITVDQTQSFPVSGGAPYFTGGTPLTRYLRVRYTNGATPQATFRLQTIVKLTALSSTPDQISSNAAINGAGQTVQVNTTQGFAAIAMYFNPTSFVGTLVFESTTDGVHWIARNARQSGFTNVFVNQVVGTLAVPIDNTKDYRSNAAGFTAFRVRCSAYTSGSVAVTVEASIGAGPIESIAPITIAPTTTATVQGITVGVAASQIDQGLSGRKSVEVSSRAGNANNKTVYVGFNAAVSSANGRQLQNGQSITIEVSEAVQIWAVADVAGMLVDVTEVNN